MPRRIARRLKKHIDEESVFKEPRFTVHTADEEPRKVIEFDHRTLRQADTIPLHVHRHKATPAPQVTAPPTKREFGRHRFTVREHPARLAFRITHPTKPSGLTREQLVKKEFVVNPKNPFLTYYAPIGGSFGVVGKHHMENLPHAGWNVRWVVLEDGVREKKGYPSPIGVIHPLLYWGVPGWSSAAGRRHYRQAHKTVVGFEVADSDAIGRSAISLVNKVDLLMVPSETAKKAFVNSGLETRIEVVQHGVSELYNAPKNPLPKIPRDGVKVLYFQVHSRWRKGGDVVQKVMSRILEERKDVKFLVRSGDKGLCTLPQTIPFPHWVSDGDLVRLYDCCDILLSPSRGGAFELNVLEAMARGLVVVASSYPSIKEYAEGALFIKDKGQVRSLPGNSIHVGKGSDPDPDHAYELMNYAIDNLDELKRKAEGLAPKLRERYNWRNTANRIAECLRSLD